MILFLPYVVVVAYHYVLSPPIFWLELVLHKQSKLNICHFRKNYNMPVRWYFRGGKLEQKIQEAVQLGGPEAAMASLLHPTLHTPMQPTLTGWTSLMAWLMVAAAQVEITAAMCRRSPDSRLHLSRHHGLHEAGSVDKCGLWTASTSPITASPWLWEDIISLGLCLGYQVFEKITWCLVGQCFFIFCIALRLY